MKSCPNCGKEYPDDANFCPVDAGHLVAKEGAAPEPLRRVDTAGHELLNGRFGVGDLIGGHRTGAVHQALDKQGTTAVVKFVDRRVFPTQLLQQRSERELKQLQRLQHPGVVRIFDHGRREDSIWIASELADGMPLDMFVAQNGPLAPEVALAVVAQVGAALDEAAKHGVVHRDLAAKNVLLDYSHRARLINFGTPVPYTDKIQGVLEYIAPEQVEGKPVDQRSNIYSLGVLSYFALTGRTPFEGTPEQVLHGHAKVEPQPPGQLCAISPQVEAVILKALEKSSSKRFMTLRQFLSELEAAATGQTPVTTLQGPGPAGKGHAQEDMAKTLIGMSAVDAVGSAAAPVSMPAAGLAPVAVAAPVQPPVGVAPVAAVAPAPVAAVAPAPVAAVAPAPIAAVAPAPIATSAAPAAPVIAKGAAGKGNKAHQPAAPEQTPRAGHKAKFRETMWFKKGELDEAAAQAAAQAKSEEEVSLRSDSMEIDERYKDDGTLTAQDKDRLSLRTGATMMMEAMPQPAPRHQVTESELVSEMTAGRSKLILGIVAAVVVIGVVVAIVMSM